MYGESAQYFQFQVLFEGVEIPIMVKERKTALDTEKSSPAQVRP